MLGTAREDRGVVERAEVEEDQRDAEHEAEVADAVDEERLHRAAQARGPVYQKPISR